MPQQSYLWPRAFQEPLQRNTGLVVLLVCLFSLCQSSCSGPRQAATAPADFHPAITLPLGGNSWKQGEGAGRVTNEGIQKWRDSTVSFTAYVRLSHPGELKLWLDAVVPIGESKVKITIGQQHRIIALKKSAAGVPVYAGSWSLSDTGYVGITLQGLSREGAVFADVKNLFLDGTAAAPPAAYVKNNEGQFFYWGRRGPSVHLNYVLPEQLEAEWFYNEVTVPEGEDVLGSYFMADGFSGGYFGMQVNSPTRRHILFSVWSPYKTDDPEDIPDSMQVQLLRKGPGVVVKQFGNEGSGGQSYLNYLWKAGNTYKFLMHAVPDESAHTVFTAYFFAPELGSWQLIASFRRPKTHSYLQGLHSFLENFDPEQGEEERHVFFGNQWIYTNSGQWVECNKVRFTTDNTGRKGYRMDYAGGVEGDHFYLKNDGFFNAYTPANTLFTRPYTHHQPAIDFSRLP